MMRALRFGMSVGSAAALCLSSCRRPEPLVSIRVSPSEVALHSRRDSAHLVAKGFSSTGRELGDLEFAWSSKNSAVARVDESGRVTPVHPGATEIRVSVGDVSTSVPIEVLLPERMDVWPKSLTLMQDGDGQRLEVHVYDFRGRRLRSHPAVFSPEDDKVVDVKDGKVFPLFPGNTSLKVQVENLMEEVSVTVTPSHTDLK